MNFSRKFMTIALSFSLTLASVAPSIIMAQETEVSPQDNLYLVVNAEWLSATEIPADLPSIGNFEQLNLEVEELLMADTQAMLEGSLDIPNSEMEEYIKFYDMTTDYDTREAEGTEALEVYFELIDDIEDYEDLQVMMVDWHLSGLPLPFSSGLMADMKNAEYYALALAAPSTILPDVSLYEDPQSNLIMMMFNQFSTELLILMDFDSETATKITEEAIAFDALLVPHLRDAEAAQDVESMYNPRSLEEVDAYSDVIQFSNFFDSLIGQDVDQVIVDQPDYFEAFNDIVTPDNLELLKSWMTLQVAYTASSFLTEEIRLVANYFPQLLQGTLEAMPQDTMAFYVARSLFAEVVGVYYGETYFGPEARTDVETMVHEMIDVYKNRLQANDWLTDETIEQAIVKLDALTVHIGYPDEFDPLYSDIKVNTDLTLWENVMELNQWALQAHYADYNEPVDHSVWLVPADTVNAFYNPLSNSITFPAAILQAPFYDLDQSSAENYGGIGAVIAHEISHAFDNNGAKFDQFGNLTNWWTEEDLAAFEEKSELMVAQWDGMPYAEGTVNGRLTVSENIADLGGIMTAYETLMLELTDASDEDKQLAGEEYFNNWVRIWRSLQRPEYTDLLLILDSHAPNELRAIIPPQNIDAFYNIYDVEEGDGMYMTPEERLVIW